MTTETGRTMLDLALEYAASGWPVFPCRAADEEVFNPRTGEFEERKAKSPLTDTGLKAATRNERIIRRWWADHPDAMVGVPTGAASGVWVLDIDRRPDVDGSVELDRMEAEHGKLPDTVTVRTPSGGRHMMFKLPPGVEVRNRGALGPGQDVRGFGGYVVAAGSVMADGRTYEWESRPDEPAEAPQWLLDLVVRKDRPSTMPVLARSPSTAYVDAAIDCELADLAATPKGNRNNKLNDAAFSIGTFVGAGALAESEARSMLQSVAQSWGRDWAQCVKTIENGLKAGMRNPRVIPEAEPDDLAEEGARIAARLLAARGHDESVPEDGASPDADDDLALHATPFEWKDPASLPRREFLYGYHIARKYVSVTVAPGGLGKSSLTIAEALAMATGRALLGTKPPGKLKVWTMNLEDDRDELERRFMAACKHYHISAEDLDGHLFLDSGREQEVVVAREKRPDGFMIVKPIVEALTTLIRRHQIDVLIVDPFVSSHQVSENDNGMIDRVAKLYAKIAGDTNCAIEIVHHSRKVSERDVTVDDARGASALISASRSARVLNRMTEEQAREAGVGDDERLTIFGVQRGKGNLAPLSARSEWRKLESVALGNGAGLSKPQDHAPVVVEWVYPSAERLTERVPEDVLALVKVRVANSDCRESEQSKDWVGHRVADALQVDSTDRAEKKKIASMVRSWISQGVLKVVDDKDATGQTRKFVRVA